MATTDNINHRGNSSSLPLLVSKLQHKSARRLIKMARLYLVLPLAVTTKALSSFLRTNRPPRGAEKVGELLGLSCLGD
ncbi:hypothetical protein V6N13_073800 [Hibiscus sabdariffa]|uniref:Uncharacterized protein n=1 Tax=Hibiscus sabdariffa TaxID=183260 RepID=A0ABR2BY60_9ROSI